MCGVHLLVDTSGSAVDAIRDMVEACSHRGHDNNAIIKISENVFLASNRLKILDFNDEANQPICDDEKSAYLSWNGFLYNYQDLKNELLNEGVIFKTRSDGEVLFQWLLRKGREGIKDLQGMFAFVFVHIQRKEILLARDPVGVKSLFYYHNGDKLICSSEARCLTRSGISKNIDQRQFMPYLYLRTSLPSASFFANVHELLPGQIEIFDLDGNKKESSKITVNLPPDPKALELNQSTFEKRLTEAVLKHFTADVPVGMVLSGGADSSLLYHIWYKETGVPLITYTIGFELPYREKSGDAAFAASLTKRYGGGNQEIKIGPDYFLETWEEYIAQLDQPIGDSASYLTWVIAKEAKKNVKILVSGVGADELFGGYNRHVAFRNYLKRPKLWNSLAPLLQKAPIFSRSQKKFLDSIHRNPDRTFINFAALAPVPEELGRVLQNLYPGEGGDFKKALTWDQKMYMVQDLLKIHDNACMAHGIEGRVPFLDWPMVSLSNKMNNDLLMETIPKRWIKQILIKEGLAFIANRKKSGFGLPVKDWLLHHASFRNKLLTVIKDFGIRNEKLLPFQLQVLLKNPEKYISQQYLLLFNIFLLSEWVNKNTP
jgi:asparagine synthase (glutamine-hydrolysing)